MLKRIALLLYFSFASLCSSQASAQTPKDPALEGRVQKMLSNLSLEQKVELLNGTKDMYIDPVPSIGMPRIKLSDGPTGVRVWGPATAYPAGIAMAATWDPALIEKVGQSLGRDARARGVHILLGPGMDIYRAPMNGRNFEYFGEDPFLAARMAVAYIRGVQSQGVIATAKHYVANDSEFDRHHVNAVVGERTLREIYLPPFEASVKEAHVGAVMDSYNLLNGEHTTQNAWLDNEVLKHEWHFDGILMSDWDATYNGLAAANAGLDLEMPNARFMNRRMLLDAIHNGTLSPELIDDKVRRILRVFLRFGFFDRAQEDLSIPLYSQPAREIALQAARESMVLLKNDGVLPLNATKVKTIAVIGPDAFPAVPGGGGSSFTTPFTTSSFLTGISDRLAERAKVLYARGLPAPETIFKETEFTTPDSHPGLLVETYSTPDFSGTPARDIVHDLNRWKFEMWSRPSPARQSVRWSGIYTPTRSGPHLILAAAAAGDTYRVVIDGRDVITQARREGQSPQFIELNLTVNHPVHVVVEYKPDSSNIRMGFGIRAIEDLISPEARKIAASADVAIVSVGFDPTSEGEALDRSFALPWGQAALINAIAAVNPKTIVNVTAGGAFETASWLSHVAALIHNWYPGQEGGRALTEILFGDRSPEGKLPISFESHWEENPVHDSYYPNSKDPGKPHDVDFTEGLMLGYRYYTTRHVQPLFPFGFGLSYSTFRFSDLRLSANRVTVGYLAKSPVIASVSVTNTGTVTASQVVELYVHSDSSRVERPDRELKAFAKVRLNPGESQTINLELPNRSFAYYDTRTHAWQTDDGTYRILVGDSSVNLVLTGVLRVEK